MHSSRIYATVHVMSTVYNWNSLTLRKEPFSFADGLSAVFDYTPVSANYHISPTPQIADARAIASDFLATGNDMRAALADYAGE